MANLNNVKRTKRKHSISMLHNNQGTAMMVAVVIIAILMVFTFSLLLVSYTLFASQNKKVASRKNAEAANTLALALTKELEDDSADARSDLWRYLRCNVGQNDVWPYYDEAAGLDDQHGEKAAFRYFDMKINHIDTYSDYFDNAGQVAGFPGEVQLCVYWMPPEGADLEHYDSSIHSGIRLFVEITCNTASQTYVTTNEYKLNVSDFSNDNVDSNKKKALNNIIGMSIYNPYDISKDAAKLDEKWRWEFIARE